MNHVVTRLLAVTATAGLLAACSTDTPAEVVSPTTQSSAQPEPAASAPVTGCTGPLPESPAPVEISSRIAGGAVDPFPPRVDVALGTAVVLRVEADSRTEIHVHGFDVLAEAAPGAPACLEFTADAPGVYEIEAHPATLIAQLAVR